MSITVYLPPLSALDTYLTESDENAEVLFDSFAEVIDERVAELWPDAQVDVRIGSYVDWRHDDSYRVEAWDDDDREAAKLAKEIRNWLEHEWADIWNTGLSRAPETHDV